MLFQLHHQFTNHTEFVAQRDIDNKSTKEFQAFLREMQKEFQLPEGAQWMACTEESYHFVKTHANRHTI